MAPPHKLLRLVDLVEHATVIEEFRLSSLPAAEVFVDSDKVQLGKLLCVFGRDLFITRAVEIFGSNFLSGRAVQVFEVRFSDLAIALLSAFLSTTATGGSARIDSEGTTMSNLSTPPSSFSARNASFSHASNTSPDRC